MSFEAAQQMTALTLATFRLNGVLQVWGDRFSASFGLTSARWQMLGAIAMAGQPLTIPHIAMNMGVTRQGALKQLNLLHKDGLVESVPNPLHKRSSLYVLTDKGQMIYAEIDKKWNEHARKIACAIDLDAFSKTNALITEVTQIFTEEMERQYEA